MIDHNTTEKRYPDAPQDVFGGHPATELLSAMFHGTSANYDKTVRIATLGMDYWWKKRLMQMIPAGRNYRRILDLGCGTGIATVKLAERYPEAEVVGIDLMRSYLDVASTKLQKGKIRNVKLVHMRIEDMGDLPGEFDLVLGSFIPKLVDIECLADGCDARIAPGGVLILHDFIVPSALVLRLGFHAYWLAVKSLMRLQKGWKETSQNLFRIIRDSNWKNDVQQRLTAKGFTEFHYEIQPLQVTLILRALRPY